MDSFSRLIHATNGLICENLFVSNCISYLTHQLLHALSFLHLCLLLRISAGTILSHLSLLAFYLELSCFTCLSVFSSIQHQPTLSQCHKQYPCVLSSNMHHPLFRNVFSSCGSITTIRILSSPMCPSASLSMASIIFSA